MSNPTAAQWAELDTSDIASIASDDLNAHRPNRWQGPESTWRALTEHERSLWHSLKTRENQDLSTHLYNAFSLKKRSKDPALAEDFKIETEDGKEAVWAPPKMWAAWPLAEGRLPSEDFVAREEGEDEDFTFRRKDVKMPSDDLSEVISATILRTAKKRFMRRNKTWADVQPSVEEEDEEEQSEGAEEERAEEEDMDVNEDEYKSDATGASTRNPTKTYEPVVAADDELSHRLLQPSARHIITKLDSTLDILHHTRTFGANGNNESDFDASESEPAEDTTIDTPAEPRLKLTKRGRPRKVHLPREGESHEDMLLRIAREGHRRVPKLSKEQIARKREAKEAEAKKKADAAFDSWMEEDESEQSGDWEKKGDPYDFEDDKYEEGTGEGNHEKDDGFEDWLRQDDTEAVKPPDRGPRQRMALRDWSDVIGAASLAGFPPNVIARTVQRCANLFGESMAIRNLQETPHQEQGVHTKEYRPEPIHLPDSEGELSESGDDKTLDERRTLSRRNSRIGSSSPSPASSRSRSRSRSSRARTPRSRSASVGQVHFCSVLECERAATGFSRRANLRRHMDLVHKGMVLEESASSAQSGSEVDSEDEMLGAVHVDGFLKPVIPSKGWRGEDMETRKRKKGWQKRRAREGTDDTTGDASA